MVYTDDMYGEELKEKCKELRERSYHKEMRYKKLLNENNELLKKIDILMSTNSKLMEKI